MIGYLFQGDCERCEGKGETHGHNCIVRKLIFNWNSKYQPKKASPKEAMDAAVSALAKFIDRDKKTAL